MANRVYRPSTDLITPMFEEFLRPMAGWGGRMGGMIRTPDSDVVETENEIRVTVELPGMKVEDIDLDLENNILTISGEKREERQDRNETWHLSERRYGKFSRSFVLPRDVEADRIEAHFGDGVLNVVVPKSAKARRRRIEIHGGGGHKRVEAGTDGNQ